RRSLLKLGGAGAIAAAASVALARSVPVHASSTDVYNVVKDFGADSTGANDATSAIQAAIDAARASNGGTVFFPTGTYQCAGQLNLDQSKAIWFEGSGGETAGAAPGAQLRYAGADPSFISARSSTNFSLHRLGVF